MTVMPSHRPGRSSAQRFLAAALFGLSLGMAAFAVASLVFPGAAALPDRPAPLTVLIVACVMLSYPLVGTLIVMRQPGNVIGWLFVVLGLGFTFSFFSTEYVGRALVTGWPLPGVLLVAWISGWSLAVDMAIAFVWIPLLFPTGRLPGPRWGIVAWAAALTMILGIAATALRPGTVDPNYPQLTNPVGAAGLADVLEVLAGVSFPAIALLGVLSIVSLVVRFRRGSRVERLQIKWLLLASASFLVILVFAFATQVDAVFVLALLAAAGIPASAGIAILRYRLWDIDRLVSRSIGWAVVSGILVIVFVVLVVVLQAVLAPLTADNTLAVAASTLVAFALFQPLRRRVQRAVDRRFNRGGYDAARTIDAFALRLRGTSDPGAGAVDLIDTAIAVVQPDGAALWIRESGA